jgi:hypothetical protein
MRGVGINHCGFGSGEHAPRIITQPSHEIFLHNICGTLKEFENRVKSNGRAIATMSIINDPLAPPTSSRLRKNAFIINKKSDSLISVEDKRYQEVP